MGLDTRIVGEVGYLGVAEILVGKEVRFDCNKDISLRHSSDTESMAIQSQAIAPG